MSQSDPFAVELPDGDSIETGHVIEHVEYGPMVVDEVRLGSKYKRVRLQAELGPEGLTLTGDEVRERWGKTLHDDPQEIATPRVGFEGIGLPERASPEADLTVSGADMEPVELVAMHARAEIVRAMEAVAQGIHPDEVDVGATVDWEQWLAEQAGENE